MVPLRRLLALTCALVLGALSTAPSSAQTVALAATPASGISPQDVTLTWSTSGFPTGATVSCVASGGWTGTKAASGTAVIAGVLASATYTLNCSGGTEPVTLTWTPPTTNTDGTPLTNLARYTLYHGTSATLTGGSVATVQVNAPASTYTLTGLPPGLRYFALTADNSNGVSSVLSEIKSKTVLGISASASASVTISPRPNPPTNVTVGVVTGMNVSPVLNVTSAGKLGTALKGFAAAGTACSGPKLGTYRGNDFYEIDRSDVQWWGVSATKRVAAACSGES